MGSNGFDRVWRCRSDEVPAQPTIFGPRAVSWIAQEHDKRPREMVRYANQFSPLQAFAKYSSRA